MKADNKKANKSSLIASENHKSQNKETPITIDDVFGKVVKRAQEYLKDEIKLENNGYSCKIDITLEPKIKDFTAITNLKGNLKGTFAVSVDEGLAKYLARKFLYEEINENQLEEYIEDTIGEILNIILGNAISQFSTPKGLPALEPPVTIKTSDSCLKIIGSKTLSGIISTKIGSFTVNIVT